MAVVPASRYRTPAPLPKGTALAPPRPPGEVPKGTNLTGVLLAMVPNGMLLVGLLAAWFTIKGGSAAWPPRGTSVTTYLPSIITITAAMSSVSMQWAVSSIRRNDQRNAAVALALTLLFGIAIVNAQWYSMVKAPFGIARHAYGTLYHLLIGYHAVNQAMAVGALVLVGARALVGHFGRENYDPLRAVAAYWHYTVGAWGVIMSALFLFSAHS